VESEAEGRPAGELDVTPKSESRTERLASRTKINVAKRFLLELYKRGSTCDANDIYSNGSLSSVVS
jgi:hypothetical protein